MIDTASISSLISQYAYLFGFIQVSCVWRGGVLGNTVLTSNYYTMQCPCVFAYVHTYSALCGTPIFIFWSKRFNIKLRVGEQTHNTWNIKDLKIKYYHSEYGSRAERNFVYLIKYWNKYHIVPMKALLCYTRT